MSYETDTKQTRTLGEPLTLISELNNSNNVLKSQKKIYK